MTTLSKILLVVALLAVGGAFFVGMQFRELQAESTSQLEIAKKNIEAEKKRGEELQGKLETAAAQSAELKKEIEGHQETIRTLKDQLQTTTDSLADMTTRAASLEQKSKDIQARLDETLAEQKETESRLFAKEDEIRKLKDLMYVGPPKPH